VSSASFLWLNRVTQWFSGEPLQTPRTRCNLRQSPLMTLLPPSPGSTLVLRLYQETVHDFILLFMPPCGSHLTPLATGSLKRSLLVFSTPGGLTGNNLSRLFFTWTNTSQAATCTCNTQPRISPHNVVNHSSQKEATIHRSWNHTWSSNSTHLGFDWPQIGGWVVAPAAAAALFPAKSGARLGNVRHTELQCDLGEVL
jgi:hypothetical protein